MHLCPPCVRSPDMSGHVQTCPDMSRHVQTCLDTARITSRRRAYFRLPRQLSQLCAQTLHIFAYYPRMLLAEPDQTPHITMWHYGCGRLLRCGCAGSMRREGYGGCAGAVVLGYGRSAPLNTAVECSSSPQHRGSKATCRPPSPGGSEKIPKVGDRVNYDKIRVHALIRR